MLDISFTVSQRFRAGLNANTGFQELLKRQTREVTCGRSGMASTSMNLDEDLNFMNASVGNFAFELLLVPPRKPDRTGRDGRVSVCVRLREGVHKLRRACGPSMRTQLMLLLFTPLILIHFVGTIRSIIGGYCS